MILDGPANRGAPAAALPRWQRLVARVRAHFAQAPTLGNAFGPALLVSALLFVRSPLSNYIFDEQEALLANPYVNGTEVPFWRVLERDFWGLPPDRSIGSYRPLPNLIWRTLWQISEAPWLHHWVNVVVHALNAALLATITFRLSQSKATGWLAGAAFVSFAILTEAVTGVVGIADVLSGLCVLLAVLALWLPMAWMPVAVFGAMFIGFLSKESVLACLPLVAGVAFVAATAQHPGRPARLLRAGLALLGATAALVAYTELRRHFFPTALPDRLKAPLPDGAPVYRQALHEFLRWFQQPRLPHDPINNPLVQADGPHRIAGGLRVYWRGLVQLFFPFRLSGDYSFPQEPVPTRLVFFESVAGAAAMLLPPLIAAGIGLRRWWRGRSGSQGPPAASLWILALIWIPVAYFPHSNLAVLLPTVRAERFWYLPAIGAAWAIAAAVRSAFRRDRWRSVAAGACGVFFALQAVQARLHALDYASDLRFWQSTRASSPRSAKAHLNYSVMIGARGHLQARLDANAEALRLAPDWPMAEVYYADALCRMQRPDQAWPHYVKGLDAAPNDSALIGLALQCLWDTKSLEPQREQLEALIQRHPGSWLAYLGNDILLNGDKNRGVDPKYRPRGYDEGPKGER